MDPFVARPDRADSAPDPNQTARVLARPRLLAALNRATASRLTLVIAPAGYGKTTLLGEWVRGRSEFILWRTLGELDNAPTYFLQGLSAELRSRFADISPPLATSPLAYALARLFHQAAQRTGQPWLLILDDYHLITNPQLHQALDTVLSLPDWPVHLMIASRNLPPLTMIARLRVEGRLTELDEADLRFDLTETQCFLAARGLVLQEADVRQVAERTEGWPSALQLVHQALQRSPHFDLPAILGRISDERPLFDYLAGQVLAHQPPAIQDFLRRTALLPYLSSDLCNAYLDIANAATLLNELEREHLFIAPVTEATSRRLRYHALFQAFLQRCLELEEGAAAVRAWHRRAATCLLANQAAPPQQRLDDQSAAVEHLLAANEWTDAAQVIANLADTLDFGNLPRLEPWFARLPTEVITANPRLLIALGQLRERQGRWGEALAALQQAERVAQSTGAIADLTQAYRWQAWVYFRQDRYAESIALCRQALAVAPTDNAEELAAIYNILANCYGNSGELEQQQRYHRRALELFRRLGYREREAQILHNIAAYDLPQGLLREALETEQISLRILDELHSYRVCFPLITLAQTYLQCGEFEQARAAAERLLRLADAYQDAIRRAYALLLLGHLHREQGNTTAARSCYEEAWGIAGQTQDGFLCFELHQGQARLALDAGDLREARRQGQMALERSRQSSDCQLTGRALITLGQIADAAGDLQQSEVHHIEALRLVEQANGRLDQTLLHLRLADLCRRDGRDAEAQAHLGQAVALSQVHGYDFLFTGSERDRVLPLLVAALSQKLPGLSEASRVLEIDRLLTLIGAPAVEPLLALLDMADQGVQARVIQILGEIGDERAAPALSRLRRRRPLQEAVKVALERIAAAPQPPLRVLALGDFQVWRGDNFIAPATWQPRRKARLLLLYLLHHAPRAIACDELIEALWPDLAPDSARRALNTTFSDLRHILEPYLGQGQPSRYLTRDDETLAFTGAVWYDVAAFQQAVQAGGQAARQALELYRGDFLPEEPYADWVLHERERLRSLYLNTLTAWLEERVQAGEWRAGVDLARRILDMEPWLEEVWRALMLCLARLGRRSEALRAYQECVRALQQELDAAPSAETQALYNQLNNC